MTAVRPVPAAAGGDEKGRRFRLLPTDRSPDELEKEMLSRWKEESLFQQTLSQAEGKPEFVFFEGPPTANGKPGIHHVFSRTVKDLFCRYRAMSGNHVARKAGWDTHGLPVEIEVEKRIEKDFGIRTAKQQIEQIGVARFNEMCRESVWRYRTDWEELSERIGYWLDYSDPYVTYSNNYIESVWWALATMFRGGRLYRGHKVLPYCARCGTTLSSHEVAQGYKDVKDPSAYVALDLVEGKVTKPRRRILLWTTTPWTLVSNVALAVNPALEYVELRKRKSETDETIILALARTPAVLGDDFAGRWETVGSFRGSDLVGKLYKRPLDWVEYKEGKHELIIGESFVSAEEGTGVVHMAPAFGADDYAAGQRNGLAFLQPVNLRGEFPEDMPLVGGMFVKDADAVILEELKRRGVLWKSTLHEHAYPHCWRCETPLLYYARTSWFIRTTEFKDAMLVRNSRVDWHPAETGSGRFGEWLTNNIDWAVSRDRYWGTPLPIWVCERDDSHAEAIGGYAELSERSGLTLGADFDSHKPFIDSYTWACKCGGTMRRTPEVIDAWFDSGSMPFAQWHFPFENRDKFERYYPADFIAEGIDQTRGWFYSLLAIATGLGDALPNNVLAHEANSPVGKLSGAAETVATVLAADDTAPYRAVVVNDLVLDAEGQKMSKRLGNIIDPASVIPRYGADAVRLFLTTSSQLWTPRRFDEAGIRDTAGRFLLTFKNVYTGIFAEYANFGWSPSDKDPAPRNRPPLDRWILSRLATVEREADELLGRYEATNAAKAVMAFFDEDVSKWYVRQSRHRFYDVDGEDNRAAFATLHEIIAVTCRLLAPFAPFITDWVHRELTGGSVHLAPFTRGVSGAIDVDLERAMGHIRTLTTLGRAAREDAGVKVRQPLARLVCVVPARGTASKGAAGVLEELSPLLAAELNIKTVQFISSADDLVTLKARPNFRSLGKKFGKDTPLAAEAVQALSSEALAEFEAGKPLYVSVGNESRELSLEDLTVVRTASGDMVVKEEGGYFAALDSVVTRELRLEGLAREVVSRVQRLRKELGFAVSDRITLRVGGGAEIQEAVKAFQKWIADEVLALKVAVGEKIDGTHATTHTFDLDGQSVEVALERAG
ncbi:MAG TPA: isoleucine--tRNA ligase [Gemmatimonadaceae bacterium]|nr:isoleucine--tRNA ligase [Gemmatimonadaceae bacterium]